MEGIEYPETRTEDIVETIHGVEVRDPYRWLEDKDNPEVKSWIEQQMKLSKKIFESFGNQEPIRERLKEISLFDSMSSKSAIVRELADGFRFFYLYREQHDPQMRLYYQDNVDGCRIELVNPIDIDSSGTTKINCYFPSPDGCFVVCGFSKGGTDKIELRIIDVSTKKFLSDEFIRHVMPSIIWLDNSRGFYYTFNAFQKVDDDIQSGSIFYHELYSSAEDSCIFSPNKRPLEMITLIGIFNSQYLIFTRTRATSSDCMLLSLSHRDSAQPLLVSLLEESPKIIACYRNNLLYILSQKKAPKGEVLLFDLSSCKDIQFIKHKIIISERNNTIEDIAPLDNHLLFIESVDAKSVLYNFDLESEIVSSILGTDEILKISSLSSYNGIDFATFVKNSFHYPMEHYFYHPCSGVSLFWSPTLSLQSKKFQVRQIWIDSHDGTKIPMFVLHRRNLDLEKAHPVLLYCYGGFGESLTPTYSPLHVVWNELDGIYVVVNVRGGGEFGHDWHFNGIKEKKLNTISDLISASSWFIKERIAFSNKVGIRGSSNGGLIVLSAMTQKPNLFSSVFAGSPLTDMVRFVIQPLSEYWYPEYGNPKNGDDFKWLIEYSPYHNLHKRNYPSTLLYLAENDTRVDHMHAMKMTAKLQNLSPDLHNPHLLWIQKESGHEGGMPILGWIDYWSLELKFHLANSGRNANYSPTD
ncbi:MAG: prolyl oligopeptidase family serine peptidase [Candidatus Lokiarchaeota archaeon]|nr:prolyl oligopeptidase family serine peptidase [Candidatus Lokiarchaeota archaeon]